MTFTVAITGAGSGIGQATALSLLNAGWQVFAIDQSSESLATLRATANVDESQLKLLTCDVSSEASVDQTFTEIGNTSVTLSGLILSAGILRTGRLEDMPSEDFDALFAVNVRGLWLCAKAAMPLLRDGATKQAPARIVNLASIAGLRHKINSGAYAATKAAVIAMTKVMAVEQAPHNILVNAVAPATVDTPMVAPHMALGSNSGYKTSGNSPLGRIAQPQDIADVILFLLSPQARYVSGTVLPVDGATSAAFVPS